MKVINLFAGPSGGKSTTAAGLFYRMKVAGFKVELVTEYPKELTYDGRMAVMLDRQEVIFSEQNQRIHRLRKHVDYAITDSPILLSLVYPKINQIQYDVANWDALPAFEAFVLEVYHTYENMNYMLSRQPDKYQTYGRHHSLPQAIEIDNAINQMLTEKTIDYQTIPVTDSTIDVILADIYHHESIATTKANK